MTENIKLYRILNVEKNATKRDITRAYRIAALKTHPDKLSNLSKEEADQAKNNFIQLQKAYEILKDDDKRKNYDLYGWEGEENEAFVAAYEFYKDPIKEEDIESFSKTYKDSRSEEEDLIDYYKKYKGDLTNILFTIPLSESNDLDRFIKFYKDKIAAKELESTDLFTKSTASKSLKAIKNKYSKSTNEKPKVSYDDLAQQILANRNKRANDFSSLLNNLESKYSKKVCS